MQAHLKRSKAATQLTMRSAPTSAGLSVMTGSPVLTPGSMKSGRTLKKASQTARRVESSGGTTEEMAMPVTTLVASPLSSKRLCIWMPNSSAVRCSGVVTRQCATIPGSAAVSPSVSPASRYSPSTVLEFPTSIASNMVDYSALTPPESTVWTAPSSPRTSRNPRASSPAVTPVYPPASST